MDVHKDCLYTRDHLWVRAEGNQAVIGVTDFSQGELGEVVFLDLPEVDDELSVAVPFGIVESDRTVSDMTAPLSGEVVEINSDLRESPDLVNEDPYGEGWLIRLEMDESDQLDALMTPEEYEDYIADLVAEED